MFQKVQKTLFFVTSPNLKNFDKKCLTLSKKNKKSPFKHIRFGRSKSPVKGLTIIFFTFAGIKKQKISAYHIFRLYRLKSICSGTNFSSFLDFRLILSITVHSSVNYCGRTKFLGSSERYFIIKYKKQQQKHFVFLLVSLKIELPKNLFFIFFLPGSGQAEVYSF
jgi:hypothetical protein